MRILASLVAAWALACSGSSILSPADGGAATDGGPATDGGAALDGGVASDGGVSADGGAGVDGGAALDGGAPLDGGAADGGVSDGGVSDGGFFDGGIAMADGGLPDTWCELPGSVPGAVVPSGFCIRRYAAVATPRVLMFSPSGELFVASPAMVTPGGAPPGLGGVYVLPDDDLNGAADQNRVYVQGPDYNSVHGLLFHGGRLYFTLRQSVKWVPYANGDRSMPAGATPTLFADLSDPGVSDRWTHTLAVDAQGRIYVSRGQYDNSTCPQPNPRAGAVLRIGPGTSGFGDGGVGNGDVVMTGLRNPMYLNCAPWGCFGAELTGDSWLGIGGKEKLIRFNDGDNYGYPCCIEANRPVPGLTPTPNCSGVAVQVQSYPLQDTPFGFDWDLAGKFPAPYTRGLFMAFHGAFDSWANTNLRFIPVDQTTGNPSGPAQVFVSGWGRAGPIVGRFADVRFSPDGRLFFADDQAGAIYWIAPVGMRRPGR